MPWGSWARVRVWRCEGRPPLPHHFVCVEKFTLPYLPFPKNAPESILITKYLSQWRCPLHNSHVISPELDPPRPGEVWFWGLWTHTENGHFILSVGAIQVGHTPQPWGKQSARALRARSLRAVPTLWTTQLLCLSLGPSIPRELSRVSCRSTGFYAHFINPGTLYPAHINTLKPDSKLNNSVPSPSLPAVSWLVCLLVSLIFLSVWCRDRLAAQ